MKRYSIFLTAAMLGPVAAASWWGNSQMRAEYLGMQEAARQCELMKDWNGYQCEAARRPKKRKDQCSFVASISRPSMDAVVIVREVAE